MVGQAENSCHQQIISKKTIGYFAETKRFFLRFSFSSRRCNLLMVQLTGTLVSQICAKNIMVQNLIGKLEANYIFILLMHFRIQ